MTTNLNPKALRGGQRSSATKLIADAKAELAKEGGGDLVTLGVIHGKLTEKLSRIRILDDQILKALSDNDEIETETSTQDGKAVEIELAILQAMLTSHVKGGRT